jgi:hypothetical protein
VGKRVAFPGFVGSAFKASSPRFESQDLWNWYLERADSPNAKSPQALLPCPGFDLFTTLPKGPVRGLFAQNNRTFAVGGDTLYELTRLGDYIERDTSTIGSVSTPQILNSPLTAPLGAPIQVVVTHGGTIASTTYTYVITATNDFGETSGTSGTSNYGNPVLSGTNWNIVSWTAVVGATGYKVYRTVGGTGVPLLIGVVKSTTLVYNDIGNTGTSATPPTADTTGEPTGTATYGYKITATLGLGETAASPEGVTVTSQDPLDAENYNIITWSKVTNATGYNIYRTTGGVSPPQLIGTVDGATLTFNDQGDSDNPQPPEAIIPPTTNTTGTATIVDDGTPVQFASSGDAGNQLLLVSGGVAYCYDLTDDVLAPVVNGATFGGFIDSYFVALDAGTSTLKVSQSLDGFHWDGTQVYQRARAGDKWLAMAVTSNYIWLIGSQTSELWTGTGDDVSRFTPYTPVFLETGIIAPLSLTRISIGQSLMWVAQDKDGAGYIVRIDNGYTPTKVSTIAVDHSVQGLNTLADAYAFSYQQDGHTFYVLSFPTDQVTWVFDLVTGEWHRRGYWNPDDGTFLAYRPQCYAFAFGGIGYGMNLVGDSQSGRICRLRLDVCTDVDGAAIRRVRQCPHLSNLDTESTYDRVQMDMDIGLGLSSGQGADPTMMLVYSNDGGVTWGKELWRSAGKQGDTRIQVFWCRLGTTKNRVYRFVVTDPIPWRLVGAWLELEGS